MRSIPLHKRQSLIWQIIFQQAETTAKRRAARAEAFVAPEEDVAPTVDEKRKRKRPKEVDEPDVIEESKKKKKKKSKKVAEEIS